MQKIDLKDPTGRKLKNLSLQPVIKRPSGFHFSELLRIEPDFPISQKDSSFLDSFLRSIQQQILSILPKDLLHKLDKEHTLLERKEFFIKFHHLLPIIRASEINPAPTTFSFLTLCFGEHTEGIERFLPETISRQLLPGKELPISAQRSFRFRFKNFPNKSYNILGQYVTIENEEDRLYIQNRLPSFINKLKINILAVYHARYVHTLQSLSYKQQSTMIQENVLRLANKDASIQPPTAFDQMHQLLMKLSGERKVKKIQENLHAFLQNHPENFDKDIYGWIYSNSKMFSDDFAAIRDPRHISRLLGFQYLFTRLLYSQKEGLKEKKSKIYHKLFKTEIEEKKEKKTVLGVLLTIQLSNESERLDKIHVMKALNYLIKDCLFLEGSYVSEKGKDGITSLYLEIVKKENVFFTKEEIETLKSRLPLAIASRIEIVTNPIFMPRNEEEILRNVILLSNQIKYVKDIPQVIINFEKQSASHISFTIVLVRLLKAKTEPIKKLFAKRPTFLQFFHDEIKVIGRLKKKHPKEANIFKVSLHKTPFLRTDNSLDLQKARQAIAFELANIIGEFRDFNGGMILKQTQALESLKQKLGKAAHEHDFLLENFFYSITPAIMQTIMQTDLLKELFKLLLASMDTPDKKNRVQFTYRSVKGFTILLFSSNTPTFKEKIQSTLAELRISSSDLAESNMDFHDISTLGYIIRAVSDEQEEKCLHRIKKALSILNAL